MSESASSTPEALDLTAGQMLKAARERQGMHISVLAASLKVAKRKVELIEADRFDELPDATFVRALALSICRALKIDSGPVLQRLPQAPTRMLDPSRGLNRPFRERERSAWPEAPAWARLPSPPLLAALLLIGAGLAIPYLPFRFGLPGLSSTGQPGGPVPQEAAAARSGSAASDPVPAFPPTQADPAPANLAEAAAPGASSAMQGAATASAVSPYARPTAPAVPPPPPHAGPLALRATDTSWIEVRDGQGQVLLARTLGAGESVALDGALPLRVTVGNAAGTQITFRGEPVGLAPSTRDNVARLELK